MTRKPNDNYLAAVQLNAWQRAVFSSENDGLTIRQAEQAVLDAAHAEALERDAAMGAEGVEHLATPGFL